MRFVALLLYVIYDALKIGHQLFVIENAFRRPVRDILGNLSLSNSYFFFHFVSSFNKRWQAAWARVMTDSKS